MRYACLILALFVLSPLQARTPLTEEQLIQRIEALKMETYRQIQGPQKKLQELLPTIDRASMPKAWILAYQHLYGNGAEQLPEADLQTIEAKAQAAHDHETLLTIDWLRADHAKRQAVGDRAYLHFMEQARDRACGEDMLILWCGRTWREIAHHQYDSGDIASGIDSIQNAIRILQDTKGADRIHYYVARQTYGLLLNHDRKLEESIKIEKENFEWFEQQDFWAEAAVAAYNVAAGLINQQPLKKTEALHYADRVARLGEKADDPYSIALADYLRGNTYLKAQEYTAAIPFYSRAFQQFKEQNNEAFQVRTLIQKSRALAGAKQPKEAEETLAQMEELQQIEHPMELMPVLKVREDIALQRGDFRAAHAALKQYQEVFEKRKADEEQKDLQRLTTQLGLVMEKERNLKLTHEVQEAQRLKVFVLVLSILTLSTLGFAGTTLYQKRRARISHAKLQQVLDHVDLGLLTFDKDLTIDENHSAHLQKILGHDQNLSGRGLAETILNPSQLPSEARSMTSEILHAVFEEKSLAWDLNADNFPRELILETNRPYILTLRWIPIFNHADALKKVLLIMTDVTHERELTKALGDQQKRMQSLPLALREIMATPRPRLLAFLREAEAILDIPSSVDQKRALHTQKGVARSLGLLSLSNVLHEWEHDLDNAEQKAEVATQLRIHQTIATTLETGPPTATTAPTTLFQVIDPFLSSWMERLDAARLPLAELQLTDGVMLWKAPDLRLLRDCVVHGINNCLDHGFIFPQQRGIPITRPRLAIQTLRKEGRLTVTIADNGAGIDSLRLLKVAEEKGFQAKEGETLFDVLFWDGVSTADTLTLTSGRGVGLAALKAEIQSRGGTIGIRNREDGNGTILSAEWITS